MMTEGSYVDELFCLLISCDFSVATGCNIKAFFCLALFVTSIQEKSTASAAAKLSPFQFLCAQVLEE